MPDPSAQKPHRQPAKPAPAKRRSWLRRIFRALLLLLLVVAIFHRPLFHFTARTAIRYFAGKQHLKVDLHTEGTIWTNLTVRDISATPTGGGPPNPVERINIQAVRLQYSIPSLLRHGVGEFLRSFEISNADLVFSGAKSQSREETQQKKSIADTLNSLLGQPALYADKVRIENFNLRVNSPDDPEGVVDVAGVNILFHPWDPGYLKIARLKVPSMPAWENLAAETSYAKRNLYVKGLQLSPELVFDEINFDASQRAQNKGSSYVKAHLFGGTLELGIAGTQLEKKGKNLNKSYDTLLTLAIDNIDARAATEYFHVKDVPVGKVEKVRMSFKGEPELPKTWNGTLSAKVPLIEVAGEKPLSLGPITVDAKFANGRAELSVSAMSGQAMVSVNGSTELPQTVNEFQASDGDLTVRLDAPSLANLGVVQLSQPLPGSATGEAVVHVRQKKANATLAFDLKSDNTTVALKGTATAPTTGDKIAEQAEADITFDLNSPTLENVTAAFMEKPVPGTAKASGTLRMHQQKANVQLSLDAATGGTTLSLKGTAAAPTAGDNIPARASADVAFDLNSPSLEEATAPFMEKPLTGTIKTNGTLRLHDQRAIVDLSADGSKIAMAEAGLETLRLKLKASKALNTPTGANPLQGLAAQLSTDLKSLHFGTFTADSAAIDGAAENEHITLTKVEIVREENSISVKGDTVLPAEMKGLPPITVDLAIKGPRLESFGIGKGGTVLTGHLEGGGTVRLENDRYNGAIKITGGDFAFGAFKARSFLADLAVKDNQANIEKIALVVDDQNQIAIAGQAGTQAPYTFEAGVLVLFKQLGVLQPLLETFGVQEKLAGSFDFSTDASGQLQPMELKGETKLAVDKLVYGPNTVDSVRLSGTFLPQTASFPELKVRIGDTALEAAIEWQENRLRIRDVVLRQGKVDVLKGYALLPFEPGKTPPPDAPDFRTWKGPIPLSKRFAATFNAKDLDLDKLAATFPKSTPKPGTLAAATPQKSPASGILNMNLVLGGTGLKPTAHLRLEGRKLYSPAMEKLEPAELDFTAHYSEKDLTLDVIARQKEIQPLTIKGHLPIDLEAVITDGKLQEDLPLDLTLKLPPTSLALLPKAVPSMRSAAGTVGLDTRVTGTIKDPHFSGQAIVKLDYARMQNEGVPSIGKVDIDIGFTEKAVSLRKFTGELGGGTFRAEGGVQFPQPENAGDNPFGALAHPNFQLKFLADEVLVFRNDAVTTRIDSDIGINGTLEQGNVAGTVYVTHSRFYKDIDILPIALPGRPKTNAAVNPAPRQVKSAGPSGPPTLPPMLKNWTFDIAIKTRPDDQFKILGNLAKGAVGIDLHFGGTGAEPWLDGTVRIDQLTATLPFSKLEIKQGDIIFSRDEFAQPRLDISAESQLRGYVISVLIAGPATKPEITMTSEPPLSQTDIIALLATGATMGDLSSGDVIASRAGMLLFQSLYHKIFKKKNPTENQPMGDRLDVDVGAADSKTGRQEIQARFKLTDQLFLVGDVDVSGSFTGRVKYLLRFR